MLPFKLNGAPLAPAFVERPEAMEAVEDQLLPISDTQQTVLVLQGTGGMGKSQMARWYACKHKDKYTAIFWVNAASKNTLKDGIASIAGRLGLTNLLNQDGHINKNEENMEKAVSVVLNWFNEDGNTRWLLILDNVDSQVHFGSDNEREFSNSEIFDALPLLPSSSQGTLLLTSRSTYLARAFGGTSVCIDQTTLNEGLEVLCRLSGRKSHEPGAEELAKRLGYYPLALSQCGRYISETQDSFVRYLARYEAKLKSLLKQTPSIRGYQNGSIDATMSLSYEALKVRNPTSAALLAFSGCLDNTDIFWDLFGIGSRIPNAEQFPQVTVPAFSWITGLDPDWLQRIQSDEEEYDEAVRSLLMFSFARQNIETSNISIHPIVHQWSLSLYDRDLRNAVLEKIADPIGRYFLAVRAVPTPSNQALLNRLRPHADRCFDLIRSEGTNHGWAAATLISFGYYFLHHYQHEYAIFLVEAGLRLLERQEKRKISFNSLILRLLVSEIYRSWDQDHGKIIANLCAGRNLARALNLQVKQGLVSILEVCFMQSLSVLYAEQGRCSEAYEVWNIDVKRFADESGYGAVYWMAMTSKAGVTLRIGDIEGAVRIGEDILLNVRKLLEVETAARPLASSAFYRQLEGTLGFTQSELSSAYAELRQWETSQEYALSALISSEKSDGPTNLLTLGRAAKYMDVVDEVATRYSLEQSQKWHTIVYDLLKAANPNRVLQSVEKGTYRSWKDDRWTLVLRAVRTSVRHRPGTELYSLHSEKQPIRSRAS